MRRLLLSCVLAAASLSALAQAQAPTGTPAQGRQTTPATVTPRPVTPAAVQTPTPPPSPAKPATPTQAPAPPPSTTPAPVVPRRPVAPPPPARGGMAIVVTDMSGASLRDIRVQAIGPIERSGTTDGTGQLRITGMPAGTYRVRFSGEAVVEFEREVIVRGGPNTDVDVSMRPAPPPVVINVPAPAPPPAPVAPAPPTGPIGQPQLVSIPDLVTKTFLEGALKEVLVSCSTNTRTTLLQMSSDQPELLYNNAEVSYYVIGGEGAVRINGRETAIKLDSFIAVPRGVSHTLIRRGRRPLIIVTQLTGEPCEQAK